MSNRIVFEFPNEDAADCFLAWFSDCGGEQSFMQGEDLDTLESNGSDRKPIIRFDFARAFESWGYDPAKHGEDKVVVALEE